MTHSFLDGCRLLCQPSTIEAVPRLCEAAKLITAPPWAADTQHDASIENSSKVTCASLFFRGSERLRDRVSQRVQHSTAGGRWTGRRWSAQSTASDMSTQHKSSLFGGPEWEGLTAGTAFQSSSREMGGKTLATSRPITLNSLQAHLPCMPNPGLTAAMKGVRAMLEAPFERACQVHACGSSWSKRSPANVYAGMDQPYAEDAREQPEDEHGEPRDQQHLHSKL